MSTDATTMTDAEREVTDRNISLTFDLLREALVDPAILDDIPDGVNLVLLLEDDPKFNEINIELGLNALRRGEDVYFRYMRDMRERPSPSEASEEARDRPT